MRAGAHEVIDRPHARPLDLQHLEGEEACRPVVPASIEGDRGPAVGLERQGTEQARLEGAAHAMRERALFTADTVVSRAAAVSSAVRPTTSRRRSTARCEGVSTWRAATNASATLSSSVYALAGSFPSSHDDGHGSIHSSSGVAGAGGRSGSLGGPSSGPRTRRERAFDSSRHTFVAMR